MNVRQIKSNTEGTHLKQIYIYLVVGFREIGQGQGQWLFTHSPFQVYILE